MEADRRAAAEEDTGCSDAERFGLELEFVQCLANPQYLNCEGVGAVDSWWMRAVVSSRPPQGWPSTATSRTRPC